MCLIYDNKLQREIEDDLVEVEQEYLVGRDKHLELVKFRGDTDAPHSDVYVVPFVVLYATTPWGSILVIVQYTVHRGPFLHSALPVLESRQWSDNEEWSLDILHGVQVVQKGNGLYGLSKSHLISKYGVPLLIP